jgi:chemotaxis protein MotB
MIFMRNIFLAILVLLSISFYSSCVVMSTKKYNALLVQKDSLSLGWEASRNKSISLEGEIVSLKSDSALLQDKI